MITITAAVLISLAPNISDVSQDAACNIDLNQPGQLGDILSNALLSLEKHRESDIGKFLEDAQNYNTSADLLTATAKKFQITEKELNVLVAKFKHCNCTHSAMAGGRVAAPPRTSVRAALGPNLALSKFAEDVVLHVVLHEMGHALVREFDLPILANEETLADAFATHYLTTYMPDRAAEVLEARVKSWMIEASEVARSEWPVRGEHNNDARRAFQVAALAIAADYEKYKNVAKAAGMTDDDVRRARDYGTEIHRSWRRILKPLWMPDGKKSNEARVTFDDGSALVKQIARRPIAQEVEAALRGFDWHSGVKVSFVEGDGGAGWSRSKRTITVNSAYVERFVRQGVQAAK